VTVVIDASCADTGLFRWRDIDRLACQPVAARVEQVIDAKDICVDPVELPSHAIDRILRLASAVISQRCVSLLRTCELCGVVQCAISTDDVHPSAEPRDADVDWMQRTLRLAPVPHDGMALRGPSGEILTIETITVARAWELLAKEPLEAPANAPLSARCERRLDETKLAGLVDAMSRGECHLLGSPIVLDHDGNLVDGRHRITACQIAQVPFTTSILHLARRPDSPSQAGAQERAAA
jgi:hypothetical protein